MGSHAYLPPSGAKAWVQCAAWPAMNARYPQDDTEATRTGDAWHWVWAQMLANIPVHAGELAPNGELIDQEMIEAAELYCDVVSERIFANGGFGKLHVEESVRIPRVHEHNWGTPDTWAYSATTKVLEVIDGKYGHRYVDHFENWQCLDYACGILDEVTASNGLYEIDITINFTIVQPRCFYRGAPVRTWTLTGGELRAYANRLRGAAELALVEAPHATTNSECTYCPGRHACPALQQATYADAELSMVGTPFELTPQSAGLELSMLERAKERLDARCEGLREVVRRELAMGNSVPLWGLAPTQGRERWAKPDSEVVAMGDLMGVDLRKSGVVTPKQAVKAGMPPAVVEAFKFAPKGEMKLIKVNNSDAARVFKSE